MREARAMSSGTAVIMSAVVPSWTTAPSTLVRMAAHEGSKAPSEPGSGISIQGPSGQEVSKALARTASPPRGSRAETSSATV